MKVRTFLLFACMIVVPGLAMFSHRVPAEFRTATRCALWDPLLAWVANWTNRGAVEEVWAEEPAGMTGDTAASGPGVRSAGGPVVESATPRANARLADLGGIAVECRPLDSLSGTHVVSCRVAMDAAGQLHRVFQAAGRTPDEAVAALADEVERWRARLADRASSSGAPGSSAVY